VAVYSTNPPAKRCIRCFVAARPDLLTRPIEIAGQADG
jgi:hypothetical protein